MVYSLYNTKLKTAGASIHHTPRSLIDNEIKKSGDGIPYNVQMIETPEQQYIGSYDVVSDGHTADGVWKAGDFYDTVGFAYGYPDHACFYFTNIPISQGATIDSASISGTWGTSAGSGDTYARAYLNDADSASFPSNGTEFLALDKTTAYDEFLIPGAIGSAEIADLTTAVQEVVNRPGWSSGNNMQVILWYTSGSFTKSGITNGTADLDITYTQ